MGREENVEVFKDTEKMVKTNERLKSSVQASTEKQKLILEKDILTPSDMKQAREIFMERYNEKYH